MLSWTSGTTGWRQNTEIVLWPVIGEMPGNPQNHVECSG
jgi:hypothetical protein